MKRVHKSLLTAGLALGLGGGFAAYAWYGGYVASEAKKRLADQSKRLFDFGRVDAKRLVLEHGGQRFVLSRGADGQWALEAPLAAPADRATMIALLDHVAGIVLEQVVTAEASKAELAEYGLDAPSLSAAVTTEDGRTHTLHVGAAHGMGRAYFVTDGDKRKIGVAADIFYAAVARDLFALRGKQIIPEGADAVEAVKLREGDRVRYAIEKRGEEWWIEGGGRADPDYVARFLLILTRDFKAAAFPTDALEDGERARYGLDTPLFTLEVRARGTTRTILVGRAGDDVLTGGPYVLLERSVMAVYEAFPNDVGKSAVDFADRTIVQFDASAVAKIEILMPDGETLRLRRQGAEWRIPGPPEVAAKTWYVDNLVLRFSKLRSSHNESMKPSAEELSRWYLAPPARRLAFYDAKDAVLGDVWIGKRVDDAHVYITAPGLQRVDAIADERLSVVPNKLADLVDGGAK